MEYDKLLVTAIFKFEPELSVDCLLLCVFTKNGYVALPPIMPPDLISCVKL